jgi:hypothetical protein
MICLQRERSEMGLRQDGNKVLWEYQKVNKGEMGEKDAE